MKCSGILLVSLVIAANAAMADQSAEDWYRNDYAVLWMEKPWDNVEAIVASYAASHVVHADDGSSATIPTAAQMAKNLNEWREEGWYSSDLAALKVDELNPGTVLFKAKWHDFYEDDSESFECGWYMARKTNDGWHITEYADIDCEAHGL